MSAYRAQAHLDAPLEDVWALVGNPATYPEWWPVAVEIRGEKFEVGDVYTQVVGIAGRRREFTGIIDRRKEFKELSWHCPTTGGFQRWLLTHAQGGTFVDMERGSRTRKMPGSGSSTRRSGGGSSSTGRSRPSTDYAER
jgi:hypothetical protein